MPDPAKAFFVSTPIYYVTAAPSIGSAYTTLAADMISRWHRQRGEQTYFLTGTDEHGQKVLEAANEAGATPQEFTDRLVADEWLPVLDVIDARNDDFIRTTDARHTERVREFWQTLNDNGHVYAGTYEGLYCVSCEEYKLPGELIERDGVLLCPVPGAPALSRELDEEEMVALVADLEQHGSTRRDAIAAVARDTGARRRAVYDAVHRP